MSNILDHSINCLGVYGKSVVNQLRLFAKNMENGYNWAMRKSKIWLQVLPRVSIDKNIYLFSDVRNFAWRTPNRAIKNRLDYCVRKQDLVGCDLYLDRFGWQNLAGHVILEFIFVTGERLALSIEARLSEGENYSFLKGLFLQYPIIAIWGTPEDILWLRKVRGDELIHYSLHFSKKEVQLFFENVLRDTDYINTHDIRYNLIMNNCTSLLWRIVSETFWIEFWHWEIFLPWYVDRLLYRTWLISEKEYLNPGKI